MVERFIIGLDNDIERTYEMMKACMIEVGVLRPAGKKETVSV